MHHMKVPLPYLGHAIFQRDMYFINIYSLYGDHTITHIKILEQQRRLLTKCNCIKLPLMLNLTLLCVIANYFYHIPVHQ